MFEIWIFREIIRPALDIFILAFIIYQAYQILEQTRAIQLIKGAQVIVLIFVSAVVFKLNTLIWLMQSIFFPGIIIGIAVIFQPELRKIFTTIGQRNWFGFSGSVRKSHIESIINSVEVLAMKKIGSIIVLSRQVGLKNVIETGTQIGAELSSSLILTIFTENTPLHDGAIVIRDDRIVAAGCFLPLSEQQDIKKSFGTRHRAALGLSEESDAVIIVVSEETGAISLAYEAKLVYDITLEFAISKLTEIFEIREEEGKNLEIKE
ncbi:MAG: TIGR00159 family protein [Spirochaetaceae bacterium]|nr:MAG: TIGR00159 family protein [Spirochaetaceae bacterium]